MKEESKKLFKAIKLNKDKRNLYKAGIVDEDGNLTDLGESVVLNVLMEKPEIMKELKDVAKVILDEKDEKKKD